MNKYELKMGHAQDLGKELNTRLEKAKGEVHGLIGAAEYMNLAQTSVLNVMTALQKLEVGDDGPTPEERKFAMDWIKQCLGGIHSLQMKAEQAKIRTEGKILGLEGALDVVERSFESEKRKMSTVVRAAEEGTIQVEDSRRPPPSLKAQRQGG